MKALGDYLHPAGSSSGSIPTPARRPARGAGQPGREFQTRRNTRWGVDYVKYDWMRDPDRRGAAQPARSLCPMARAIAASARPMVLSICEWGINQPWFVVPRHRPAVAQTARHHQLLVLRVGHCTWSSLGVLPDPRQAAPLRGHAPGRMERRRHARGRKPADAGGEPQPFRDVAILPPRDHRNRRARMTQRFAPSSPTRAWLHRPGQSRRRRLPLARNAQPR